MTRSDEHPARRPRRRALVHASLAVAASVVVGLSGAGGTYAFLTSTAGAPGATLSAGTLTLQVNGSASASLGTFAVSPAAPIATAFRVTNTGDAPAALDAAIAATSTPLLASHALARITEVAGSEACTTGLGGPQAALPGYAAVLGDGASLSAGATRWYCLEVALAADTPIAASGQGLGFTLTVNGTQSTS
ncbi:hypothetical protein [Microbacterium sp.]|uniref:hypothetical protein n=1 Tax=Microbacterium sp. TaxID=51671 RepID=UPI0039E27DF3